MRKPITSEMGFRLYRMLKYAIHLLAVVSLYATEAPIITIRNNNSSYSLINSIHFHPSQNVFCTTFSQNNKVYIYKIEQDQTCSLLQVLANPKAKLKAPQHALFSPDGNLILVANWIDRSMNAYRKNESGLFSEKPVKIISGSKAFMRSKPHGAAFSSTGDLLAIAYGASTNYKNAIALFQCKDETLHCIDIVKHHDLIGIPKGICFSRDGTHLLVSFAEPSCLQIFSILDEKISPLPVQTISGPQTALYRPEDVKIAPNGSYCAVSNSSGNTVSFYRFNPISNRIIEETPFMTFNNLSFPHGIDFSFDGKYLGITEFGSVDTTTQGNVIWDSDIAPQEGTIQIFPMLDSSFPPLLLSR